MVTSRACRAKGKIKPPMTFHLYRLAALFASLHGMHFPLASRGTDEVVLVGG